MYYVCVENKIVTSILDYEPAVPQGVTVVEINESEFKCINAGTHTFNVDSMNVQPVSPLVAAKREAEQQKVSDLAYLNNTDWKVLRHIREKALGLPTSMTEEQYKQLEQKRQQTAKNI